MFTNSFFRSFKRFGPISTSHRQFRAAELRESSRCAWIHGYGRIVEIEFAGSRLDERGWIVDYGDLRHIKDWIESEWDHRTLISSQDPLLNELQALHDLGGININVMDASKGYGPGIEQSCKYIFDYVDEWIYNRTHQRCWVQSVKISEHENNWSMYERPL